MPPIEWIDNGMPFRSSALGAKACGESGAAAAPPTVMNAMANALRPWPEAGNLQMPARPAKIWRMIHTGDRKASA
jgi:carbon-monoxide dehydrogenase large subunit